MLIVELGVGPTGPKADASQVIQVHSGDEQLETTELYFMRRKTLPAGGHAPTQKERLWVYRCDRKGSSGRGIERNSPSV